MGGGQRLHGDRCESCDPLPMHLQRRIFYLQ
jgi:hypothetical protein